MLGPECPQPSQEGGLLAEELLPAGKGLQALPSPQKGAAPRDSCAVTHPSAGYQLARCLPSLQSGLCLCGCYRPVKGISKEEDELWVDNVSGGQDAGS